MTLLELPGGFLVPLEWAIGVAAGFIVLIAFLGIMLLLYFRKGDSGPEQENLAALVGVDEHGSIQEGPLIGNVERSEDELYFKNPEWSDNDPDSQSGSIVDVAQKIPLPLRDASGRKKYLYVLRDMGHIDCVSASTIVSEKIPKRWDLPLIDPRRLFRHLEGPRTGNSISNLLSSRMGILTILGVGGFFSFFTFFVITASGHLR